MGTKIKDIFTSIRFWQVLIGAVIFSLGNSGTLDPVLANTIAGILGISVTIRTVDKLGGN